jgi:hypothetical protein
MATMHTMPTSTPRITSRCGGGPYRDDEFFVLADNKTNDGYHGSHEYQVITNSGDSNDCFAHARAVENAFTKSSSKTKNYVPYIGPPS